MKFRMIPKLAGALGLVAASGLSGLLFCQCGGRLYGHQKTRKRAEDDNLEELNQ